MDKINIKIKKHIVKLKKYKFKKNHLNKNNKPFFKKAIGLYDPLGKNINPLTGLPYENIYQNDEPLIYKDGPLIGVKVPRTYKNLAYIWTNLKLFEYVSPILDSINNNQITIIKSGTGVGKTVITPKIALQAFNFKKKVICTVPKQLIARNNASFSAQCLDVRLGEEVGYFYMGDNQTSDKTILTFTTPGSLKSKITGSDPYLSEYSCVIIDEIHERSVQTDQLLLLMKEVLEKRPDFKLILMSATVDLTIFKEYFTEKSNFTYNEVDIQDISSYEVKIYYEKTPLKNWKKEAVDKIIDILKTTTYGDILVFVKSGSEGNLIKDEINKIVKDLPGINPFCTVLEGKTPKKESEYATEEFKYKEHPDSDPNNPFNRKIVMATNVAESSLTVDGIVFVIDNGYSFESAFYPKESANSLIEERISQAAANQRKGRAGRTQPGVCYRMYTEEEFNKFKKFPTPDIQKTDITNDILDIFSLNYIKTINDVRTFLQNLISPPSDDFINNSLNKLYILDAITNISNEGIITELGIALSQFRVLEPNFAKSILASYYYYCKYEVMSIILISMDIDGRMDHIFEKYYIKNKKMSQSEIKKEKEEFLNNQKKFHSQYGDYLTLLNIYNSLKDYMKNNKDGDPKYWCRKNGINSRVFVNRNKKNNWDIIYEKSRKLNDILMKIIRPARLKKQYYNLYKNDGGKENIKMIENEINNKLIIDSDNDILDTELYGGYIDEIKNKGYHSKPYEINLFPNTVLLENKEKNILMSFIIGNLCNSAILTDSNKKIYKTCFPIHKVDAKFDQNTTLPQKTLSKYILYNELFTTFKDQKILKMNIVTKIPTDIISKIKNLNIDLDKICFLQNIQKDSKQNPIGKDFKQKPISKDSKQKPIGKDSKQNPIGKDSKQKPIGKDSKQNPIGKDSKQKPFGKDSKQKPFGKDSKQKPFGKDSKQKPFGKDSKQKPIGKDSKQKPIGKDSKQKPIDKDSKQKPFGKDSKQKPFGKDSKQKPFGKDFKQKPFGKDSKQKPIL